MWTFLPGGLLMPASIPLDKADPKLTRDGLFTLQVRARVKSHLENFIRDYMDPNGFPYSDIIATPEMDYNYRFYTTHGNFAQALAFAVMDIDYKKFKPTAERKDAKGKLLYKDGPEYHAVLNSLWSTVCRLGRPGGIWGAYSADNPRGYQKASKYKGWGGFSGGRVWNLDEDTRPVGSSFLLDDPDYEDPMAFDDDMDYTPSRAAQVFDILSEVSGIPADQWEDYLTADEYELVRDVAEDEMATDRQNELRRRKVSKKARYRRGRRGRHIQRR